jgi:RNA polymerase sigma factor (sigma-70 family)
LRICQADHAGAVEGPTSPRETGRNAAPKLVSLFCGGGVGEIERLYQNSCSPVDWAHHQPTPERLLERKQERTALAGAIECLPERQRQVLDLYYRQELSMKQISVLLGVHESRVSQIHLAAITRLRKSLNPAAAKAALRMPLPAPVAPKPARETFLLAIAG